MFYVTTNGLHGLIAETQDQSLSSVSHTPYNAQISSTWYNAQDNISISGNHSAAGALFTDWRLPTKNELNLLYLQKVAGTVGGFANNFYWSSKEYDYSNINAAWFQNFDNGFQNGGNKDFNYCVRAIRSF